LQMMVKFDLLADGKRGKKTPSSILIVDDDPQNIRLVKAMLKPFNMEVMVADGGKAGLELALKKKPDMIILDLMMPDVDGFEVVSKLREDPAASQIPILIYTAKNITSEDRERLQGNIQTIIQKGDFGKDRFLEMINNLQTSQAA
jgi:CheY-like chemotaxis protein